MKNDAKLLDGRRLLENLWDKKNRPCLRWLRVRTADGTIPSMRLGRRLFYNPEQVRSVLFNQQ